MAAQFRDLAPRPALGSDHFLFSPESRGGIRLHHKVHELERALRELTRGVGADRMSAAPVRIDPFDAVSPVKKRRSSRAQADRRDLAVSSFVIDPDGDRH